MASASVEPDSMPSASSSKSTSSKGRFRGGKQSSLNKEPTPPPSTDTLLNGTTEALEKMKINYKLDDFEIKSTLGRSLYYIAILSLVLYYVYKFVYYHDSYVFPTFNAEIFLRKSCCMIFLRKSCCMALPPPFSNIK